MQIRKEMIQGPFSTFFIGPPSTRWWVAKLATFDLLHDNLLMWKSLADLYTTQLQILLFLIFLQSSSNSITLKATSQSINDTFDTSPPSAFALLEH